MDIFSFGLGEKIEVPISKALLGGKGYGLVQMSSNGLPVPKGLVIPPRYCTPFLEGALSIETISQAIAPKVEKLKAKGVMPLVSVRSGAAVSLPGMCDTILNVGLDSDNFNYWVEKLGAECVYNSYCRLIQMFADVVYAVPRELFAEAKTPIQYLDIYEREVGTPFPKAEEQLWLAIRAVFQSWNNPRAIEYRKIHNYSDDMGTAVVVQEMVFGNYNDESCTGVLFTRNPSNGDALVVGEFLVNAQGEDVVAGIRTPLPLSELSEWNYGVYCQLLAIAFDLELKYKDMQDIEFTVQDGELYILQTRNAKRTALAALKVATEMVEAELITVEQVLKQKRVTYDQYLQAIRPVIDPSFDVPATGYGLPASNGIVTGIAVFSSEEAVLSEYPCILVTTETTPDDIKGMNAAVGILTRTGGATSHAAVVARGLDKVCVVGCGSLEIDGLGITLNGELISRGDLLTIDGNTGAVWFGIEVPIISGEGSEAVEAFKAMILKTTPQVALIKEVTETLIGSTALYSVKATKGEQDYLVLGCAQQYSPLAQLFNEASNLNISCWADSVLKKVDIDNSIIIPLGRASDVVGKLVAGTGGEVAYESLHIEQLCTSKFLVNNAETGTGLLSGAVKAISALRVKAGEPFVSIGLAAEGDVELWGFNQLLKRALA